MCLSGGQTPQTAPEFEVASVKAVPVPPSFSVAAGQRHFGADGSQFEASNHPLGFLISFAYGIRYERISGPAWIDQDRFQIVAKLPSGATRADLPAMLQKLLTDRFGLVTHHEQRVEAVYELIVSKSPPKLRLTAPGALHTGCGGERGQVYCNGSTWTEIAAFIGGKISAGASAQDPAGEFTEHTIDRPVIDRTGLTGLYDIDLQWVPLAGLNAIVFPNANRPPRDPSAKADSIFGALEAVGLKLQPARHSFDDLVIDHANRVPSGN